MLPSRKLRKMANRGAAVIFNDKPVNYIICHVVGKLCLSRNQLKDMTPVATYYCQH